MASVYRAFYNLSYTVFQRFICALPFQLENAKTPKYCQQYKCLFLFSL